MYDLGKRNKPDNILQGDLFSGISPLRTKVISRRNEFDELFTGFEKMQAISYVGSPELLLALYDKLGFCELEIIVGENLADSYRNTLEQKGIDVAERLEELLENETLKIYIPAHTIYTRLYVLKRHDMIRVIQTSANLILTAKDAKKQINYAWYLDMPVGNPLIESLLADYNLHLKLCSLFMSDLRDTLAKNPKQNRRLMIKAWFKDAGTPGEQQAEIREVFHQLSTGLLERGKSKTEKAILLHQPEEEKLRKRVERQLSPLKLGLAGQNKLQAEKVYIRFVFETYRVPLLLISKKRKELLLGMDESLVTLSTAPPDSARVSQALQIIESYIDTVDFAESSNSLAAKTSMFEALLYMFSSPFANEYMKAKRNKFGLIDTRGPRFLYIYGPSQNGKTTFLKFSSKLMTGKIIEALSRRDFNKARIAGISRTETAFPLVFDDVDPSRTVGIEDVFKSYWERWWRDEYTSPQIIITSNTPRLKEWAKSRVKRIDFDVHFTPDETNKKTLPVCSQSIMMYLNGSHSCISIS